MQTLNRIILFGDQTYAFEEDLRQLLHIKDNVFLISFFERANYALREEIARLPAVRQDLFPRFTSLLDLLARLRVSRDNPPLAFALLCINQLAHFMRCFGEGSQEYPHYSNTYAIGLCTGSFAAAAISTSQTLYELLPAAIEAVLVAFRTGLRSLEARNDIESSLAESPVWSVVVGMQEEAASSVLDTFSKVKGLSRSSKPYIGATTTTNVTISGPPIILQQLLQSDPFLGLKPVKLPIHAPYHAPHIYGASDIDEILAPCNQAVLDLYKSRFPVISSTTGKQLASSNYGSLLREVLKTVLTEQLHWDKILEESTTALSLSSSSRVDIYPVLTFAAQSLASSLTQSTQSDVMIVNPSITQNGYPNGSSPSGNPEQSKIAIIGYSGRFPEAESAEKLWELVHKGLDVHREIPEDRFDVTTHYDPTGRKKNTSKIKYGCFVDRPGLFDTRFFNMSPRESANTDPGQRLAITTAYEALEMAGFVPNRTPSSQRDRVGVFYGMTSDDWREVNSGQNIDTYFIPGGNRAFTPGRINYYFKFSGPSYSVDTACSSSFAAINIACNSLWRGDCDTAIAGGTNIMTNPDNFAGLDRGHFLSTTGNCNTFDDGADGYCRADAVGTVILKRLEDAEADNDPIKGVILGAYTNHSAEADSMTRPHVGAQAFIFKKMLDAANIDPLDVSYIEMHGTGTQAGDAVEMKSVLDVFAPGQRGPKYPLHLGSVKANVGHSESGSGVTSLIKVLKMMEKNEIPPHCGIKTKINHNFPADLKERNVNIALEPTPWKRPENGNQKRTVFLNNFSAAGGNTALLMEDAPAVSQSEILDIRPFHLVAVSGKSKLATQKNIKALVAFMNANPKLSLPSLAYTTTARRMHHNHRVIVSGHDIGSIKTALQRASSYEDLKPVPIASKISDVTFVFTGQGALYTGVAFQLFKDISKFRADLQRFDGIVQSQGFPGFLPLINGTITSLNEVGPIISQVGSVCVQMALAQLWISWGVYPSAVIGHSLGEYAALYTAGVVSASDAIFLTGTRARLLEERCNSGTHSMLAVKASLESLNNDITRTSCEVSCINGPTEIVLSGTNENIDSLSKALASQNIKSTKLEVPFAFHSTQIESVLQEFEHAAQTVVFHKPSMPYISPLLGEVIDDEGKLDPSYLRRACRELVDFQGALVAARDVGTTKDRNVWLEIGAHPICSNMIKAVLGPQTSTLSTLKRNRDAWEVLGESLSSLHLAGFDLQWDEYHRDFKCAHTVVELPSYNWDNKNYWIQYNNDFCLTKGDEKPTVVSDKSELLLPTFSTSSVQKVVEQLLGVDKSTIVIESDLNHPSLSGVLQGHVVNGAALCPSSLYADIALTIANYLFQATKSESKCIGMDVSNMTIGKPLIVTGNGVQLLRASACADWKARHVLMNFYSVTADGRKMLDHANCTVEFGDTERWLKIWRVNAYLIRSRIESLAQGVEQGQSHKIKRGLAYKLFGALVDYGPCYQGMQEVTLNSSYLEATAKVRFQTTPKEENHYFSPYWIDSLGHIAGFVMNANDGIDSKRQVFVNHGWDSMRCTTRFSRDKLYQTYVRMQNIGGTLYAGDTYIFDGDDVVALYQGVKFQGIPRQVLDQLLPGTTSSSAVAKSPRTASKLKSSPKSVPGMKSMASALAPPPSNMAHSIPQPSTRGYASITTLTLEIIADEAGLDKSELIPSSDFADFGVDSLLSLNIASRLREELGLDIESSLFSATVSDLLRFIASKESPSTESSVPSTPEESPLEESDNNESDMTSVDGDETSIMSIICRTIAQEVGVLETELMEDLDLAELGLDSLLSLTILGRLRDELEIDLPATFFTDHNNLRQIEVALGLKPKAPDAPLAVTNSKLLWDTSNATIPTATSMLLQGQPRTATKTLFLFPDGSGSATSYAPIPHIAPDIVVYGLNCPYLKAPQEMKCSIEAITPRYLQEIRRRQPHGPYYLGGWSAGGICAFDAAQELDRIGEQVARLLLIDSPFPIGLEKLPPRLYDFFQEQHIFGDKPPPPWLFPHFLAFVDSLDLYSGKAKPFPPGHAPPARLIWARDGVCKFPHSPRPVMQEDDPKEMKWLLNNRTDFSANGWDRLLNADDLAIDTMDDANHFTMMAGEKVKELAMWIRKVMD